MAEEATTRDPVERLRLVVAAASRRDLDTVMSFYACDAVLDFLIRGWAPTKARMRFARFSKTG